MDFVSREFPTKRQSQTAGNPICCVLAGSVLGGTVAVDEGTVHDGKSARLSLLADSTLYIRTEGMWRSN
jgi:hypothetical protein